MFCDAYIVTKAFAIFPQAECCPRVMNLHVRTVWSAFKARIYVARRTAGLVVGLAARHVFPPLVGVVAARVPSRITASYVQSQERHLALLVSLLILLWARYGG